MQMYANVGYPNFHVDNQVFFQYLTICRFLLDILEISRFWKLKVYIYILYRYNYIWILNDDPFDKP